MRCPGELSHVKRLNIIDWRFIGGFFRGIQRRRDRGDGLDPKDCTIFRERPVLIQEDRAQFPENIQNPRQPADFCRGRYCSGIKAYR